MFQASSAHRQGIEFY